MGGDGDGDGDRVCIRVLVYPHLIHLINAFTIRTYDDEVVNANKPFNIMIQRTYDGEVVR